MAITHPKTYVTRARILREIYKFTAANVGLNPTIRQLMESCELKSTSTVKYHLSNLEKSGDIEMVGSGNWRRIIIPGAVYVNPAEPAWIAGYIGPDPDPPNSLADIKWEPSGDGVIKWLAHIDNDNALEAIGRFGDDD
jgi:hypothetical protein